MGKIEASLACLLSKLQPVRTFYGVPSKDTPNSSPIYHKLSKRRVKLDEPSAELS